MPLIAQDKTIEKLYESRRTEIWRGRRSASGEPVVFKSLKPEAVAQGELAPFRREFRITAKAELPGVLKAYALEERGASHRMVLEDVGGESLDRLCAKAPLSLAQFLELAIKLAGTLAGLHGRRIIHKDINPSNIVFNPETGELRLIDFGLADEVPQREVAPRPPAALEGTLAFLSPEQTGRMNRAVDYRTDFYSLGVTFYRLLTRRLPFEAEDALGLVHCHIAAMPISPHQLCREIPVAVSRVVMKLMSKAAEDRYQSGWGLKADLERCLCSLKGQGRVPDFEPGSEDFAETLQPPQKLYGRLEETRRLVETFHRAAAGGCELLLVAGFAGVGKTALVHEIQKPVLKRRGNFLEGKFDQLRRDVPYSGWIQAFKGFVSALLMESESELSRWRRDIQAAVGASGIVLTEVIRNLELVIGPQPAVPELSGAEAQNRFNYVFLQFVQAFAAEEHPLVVFLDDLQWIDSASLNLLQTLLTRAGASNVFIIGAYRDNEVGWLHPLTRAFEALRKERAPIELLTLQNLAEEDVNELIADALRDERPRTAPLARLIHSKTQGNAFFTLATLKSLAERRALAFAFESRRWRWDLPTLAHLEITDNVVALMVEKIRMLEAEPRKALTWAACMGFRFSLSNLSTVAGAPEEVAQEHLNAALREGLIVPAGAEFQFVHDRVQQAAYSLIPEADKKRAHLEIGRLLIQRPSERDREEQLFTVVDHLNVGAELIEQPKERLELARLNLQAGRKAKASAAFDAAARYLEAGVALLSEQTWETDYELALELHSGAAEAATLVGNFERMEQLFDTVARRARTPVDRVEATMSRMMALSAQGRLPEFMACALDILGKLEVHIEPHPSVEAIQRGLAEVRSSFDPNAIESLIDIPAARDARTLATMRVLDLAQSSSYSGRPDLFALFAFEAVKRTLRFGSTPESMYVFTHLGLLLCGLPGGDVEQGVKFGALAMALAEKASSSALAPPSMAITSGMTWVYRRHLRDTLGVLQPLYTRLKEIGNFEYAGYAACWYGSNALLAGVELITLEQEMAAYYRDMNRIRAEVGCRWLSAFWQCAQNLLGRSACPWVLDGEAYDRPAMLLAIVETGNLAAQTALHVNTLVLCYFFERHEEGLTASDLAEKCRTGMVAMPIEPVWYFYDSLTRLALVPSASEPERSALLERVGRNQSYLEMRARHAPMNFLHKWHLVEAERARVLKDRSAAIQHYDQAMALAREHRFIQEEALANELAARFWRGQGEEDCARFFLERAHRGYSRWQAWAKVKDLEAKNPELAPRPAPPAGGPRTLDLDTVMKSARAISSEMELDRLLDTVMRIVIENAGAQIGFLLLEREGEWTIAAQGELGAAGLESPQAAGMNSSNLVSPNVVRFVARTRERVVLDDAANEGRFREEPHIQAERTRSLLCAPIVSRGNLIGVLYLKNNLATGAFTRDRIELLEMLLSQAATSVENARAYEALRRSEGKYRGIVDTANEGIWVLGPDAQTTFVNARMAGMLGYTTEEMLNRPVVDFMLEEDADDHLRRMEDLRRGVAGTFERRYRRREGGVVWTLASASPVFDDAGRFTGSFAMFTDITERKRAEEALRRLNRELRAISNCNQVLMRASDEKELVDAICRIICDEAGYRIAWVGYAEHDEAKTVRPIAWAGLDDAAMKSVRISWSESSERGRGAAGPALRRGEAVLVQDFAAEPAIAPWRAEVQQHGQRSGVALPLKDESGKAFGVLSIYSSEPNAFTPDEVRLLEELAGDLAFGICVLRARIERKEAEKAVALLSFAVNNVREAAFLIDARGHFRYVNEHSCHSLGYSREELLGMAVADVDPDFPPARWPGHWAELRAQGSLSFEGRHKAKDGRVIPVEIGSNYFEYDGQGYILALARDISERKQTEHERERLLQEVQRERGRLVTVLGTAPVGISLHLAPDGRPALFNKAAEDIFGRPVDEPGMSLSERAARRASCHDLRLPTGEPFPPEDLPLVRSLRGEMLSGVEMRARKPSGREVSLLENSAPIFDAEGQVTGAVIAFQDITPIREQERLREEFISAAAHELKTPVTTIRGYASLLQRWAHQGREAREAAAIEVINAQTYRIDSRVQEMLKVVQYGRQSRLLLSRFELGELAEQVLERRQRTAATHRLCIRRAKPVLVEADRARIEEVLVSLLENAIELSPRGGDIEVRVWAREGRAAVSVRDHGFGIAQDRQAHAFEPFYELLPSGAPGYRGTVTLGRYLSRLAIERHGGCIWLESEEGRGSTFYFSLPEAMGQRDDFAAPNPLSSVAPGE